MTDKIRLTARPNPCHDSSSKDGLYLIVDALIAVVLSYWTLIGSADCVVCIAVVSSYCSLIGGLFRVVCVAVDAATEVWHVPSNIPRQPFGSRSFPTLITTIFSGKIENAMLWE